jgi:hypothetical protein
MPTNRSDHTEIRSETITERVEIPTHELNLPDTEETHYTAVAAREDGEWSWLVESETIRRGPGGKVVSVTTGEDIPEPWIGTPTVADLTAELRGALGSRRMPPKPRQNGATMSESRYADAARLAANAAKHCRHTAARLTQAANGQPVGDPTAVQLARQARNIAERAEALAEAITASRMD